MYEQLLGVDFLKLHPKLKERYTIELGKTYEASGNMHIIQTGPKLLKPFFHLFTINGMLFPESGENVPFHLKLTYSNANEVNWERTFSFKDQVRKFNSVLKVSKKQHAIDYIGKPSFVATPLNFSVTKDGFLLMQSTIQYANFSYFKIPIPQKLSATLNVLEAFDEINNNFTIHASIHHPNLGLIMQYAGSFTINLTEIE